MADVFERIHEVGVVPVVVINDIEEARPLAQALCEGGLPCAEVTFRTPVAAEALRIMKEEFPQMFLGAGTVLTTEQVDKAIEAGAEFIVSPGLNPKVVKYCVEKNIPIIPGCCTPSEVEQALEFGLKTVKFFPAEAAGGLKMIKAMAAPYTELTFMPTGGIDLSNITEYLAFNRIIACGGSWMVKGTPEEITAKTKEAVEIVKESRGR